MKLNLPSIDPKKQREEELRQQAEKLKNRNPTNTYAPQQTVTTPQQTSQSWYSGDKPTQRETLARIMQITQQDEERGRKLQSDFQTLQADPTSMFYNPYTTATNSAIGNLSAMGVDMSNVTVNQDWLDANSYLKQYYLFSGTTNTPSKPGSGASAYEKAAYEYYQLWKSEGDTQKAEQESAALKDELTYWTQRTDRNYSDEEVMGKIDWSKYPTLSKMREGVKAGTPMELNRAVDGWSDDWAHGVIWAARNGGGTGNNYQDQARSALGEGNQWQANPSITGRLDAGNSDTYSPYSVGSTLEEEGLYFGVQSFPRNWLETNREKYLGSGSSETDQKMYGKVAEAEEKTLKLESELTAMNDEIDKLMQYSNDPEYILGKIKDNSAYSDLFALDKTLNNPTKLTGTTRAINYRWQDVENRIREQCAANAENTSNSLMDDVWETVQMEGPRVKKITGPSSDSKKTNEAAAQTATSGNKPTEQQPVQTTVPTPTAGSVNAGVNIAEPETPEAAQGVAETPAPTATGIETQPAQTAEPTPITPEKTEAAKVDATGAVMGNKEEGIPINPVGTEAVPKIPSSVDSSLTSSQAQDKVFQRNLDSATPIIMDAGTHEEQVVFQSGRSAQFEEATAKIAESVSTIDKQAAETSISADVTNMTISDCATATRTIIAQEKRENELAQKQKRLSYVTGRINANKVRWEMTGEITGYDAEQFAALAESESAEDIKSKLASSDPAEQFDGYNLIQLELNKNTDGSYNADTSLAMDPNIKYRDGKWEGLPETVVAAADALVNGVPENGSNFDRMSDNERQTYLDFLEEKDSLEARIDELTDEIADNKDAYDNAVAQQSSLANLYGDTKNLGGVDATIMDDIDIALRVGQTWLPTDRKAYSIWDSAKMSGKYDDASILESAQNTAKLDEYYINSLQSVLDHLDEYGIVLEGEDRQNIEQAIRVFKAEKLEAESYQLDSKEDFDKVASETELKGTSSEYSDVTNWNILALTHRANPATVVASDDDSSDQFKKYASYLIRGNQAWRNQFFDITSDTIDRVFIPGEMFTKNVDQNVLINEYLMQVEPIEAKRYFYLLGTEGEEKANEYFKSLVNEDTGTVVTRTGMDVSEQFQEAGHGGKSGDDAGIGGLSFAASFFYNLAASFKGSPKYIKNEILGKESNPYNLNQYFENIAQKNIRAGVTERAIEAQGEELSDVVSAFTSFGDSYLMAMAMGAVGKGVGAGLSKAASSIPAMQGAVNVASKAASGGYGKFVSYATDAAKNIIHAVPMGLNAATNESLDLITQGATPDQRRNVYAIVASTETITEGIRFNFMNGALTKAAADGISAGVAEIFTDMLSEVTGESLNQLWQDQVKNNVLGKLSDYAAVKRRYANLPEKQATAKADQQMTENVMKAGMSAILTSGMGNITSSFTGGIMHMVQNRGGVNEFNTVDQALLLKPQAMKDNTHAAAVISATMQNVVGAYTADTAGMHIVTDVCGGSKTTAVNLARGILNASDTNIARAKDAMSYGAITDGEANAQLARLALKAKNGEHITKDDVNELIDATENDRTGENAERLNSMAQETIDQNRIATEVKILVANGRFEDAAEAARKNVEQKQAVLDEAQKKRDEAIANRDAVSSNLQAAVEEHLENPTDASNGPVEQAANQLLGADTVVRQEEESVAKAQQEVDQAKEEAEKKQQDALHEARQEAEQTVEEKKAQEELDLAKKMEEDVKEIQERAKGKLNKNYVRMKTDEFIEKNYPDATEEEKAYIREKVYEKIKGITVDEIVRRKGFAIKLAERYGLELDFVDSKKRDNLKYDAKIVESENTLLVDNATTISELFYKIMGHELFHLAESDGTYTEMVDELLQMKYGEGVTYQSVMDAVKNGDKSKQYVADVLARFESYNKKLTEAGKKTITEEGALKEICADLMGDLFQGDEDLINRLVAEKPNLARRIIEYIKSFLKKIAGIDSEEVTQAQALVDKFTQALDRNTEERTGKKKNQNQIAPVDQSKFSLAGPTAQGYIGWQVRKAQDMAKQGATEEQIKEATGAVRGYDGNYWVQLDNNAVSLAEGVLQTGMDTTLENVIEAEELFEAYPQLRNVRVAIADVNEGNSAQTDRMTNEILLNNNILGKTEAQQKIDILHEAEHLIQEAEGRNYGSNPDAWQAVKNVYRDYFTQLQMETDLILQEHNLEDVWFDENGSFDAEVMSEEDIQRAKEELTEEEIASLREFQEFALKNKKVLSESAYQLYMDTVGELEARSASTDEQVQIPSQEDYANAIAIEDYLTKDGVVITPQMKKQASHTIAETAAAATKAAVTDAEYLAAVNRGDMETAQRMVNEAAAEYLNDMLLPNDDDEKGFQYHRGETPSKTFKRYAVLNVSKDGFRAAYAGNKNPTPLGVWLDAQNLQSYMSDRTQFADGSFATYIPGDTGVSAKEKFSPDLLAEYGLKPSQSMLLERGGKHSSDVPNFSQMNLKQDENGNKVKNAKRDGALPHNKLIFEIEYGISDNGNLTDYVRENGRIDNTGRNQGLAKIQPNQYYDFKTNPNAVGNWGIGGTFRITRLVPYDEVVEVTRQYKENAINDAKTLYKNGEISKADMEKRISNAESIATQKWVDGYHPEDFGLTVKNVNEMVERGGKMKLTDAVTYDDNGNVIPLSERFNEQKNDIRYSLPDSSELSFAEQQAQLIARDAANEIIGTDSEGDALAVETPEGIISKYNLETWTPEEQARVKADLMAKGFTEDEVKKWIDDTNEIASMIASDMVRLDFKASDNQVFLKKNQDYFFTLDASTLCAKRLVYQGTFNMVQHMLKDEVLMPDDLIDLVSIMREMGYETPCGICYVESRRRWLDKYAKEWLDSYEGEYKPTLDELTTSDGLLKLRSNPDTKHIAEEFIDAMNAKGSANPKVVQLRAAYNGDIIKTMSKNDIQNVKDIGGLRIQSFSDFETPHLLDMIQAVYDMSAVGLTAQAYTKVPNFAWVFGGTGIKINLSLIGKGTGLDADGNLVFDDVEGMPFEEAMKLRERYSENVGTILVGINDEHIIAAMGDSRIDFIIPFHQSGWSKGELKRISVLKHYKDYTATQNERYILGPKYSEEKDKGQKAVNNWIAKNAEAHPDYQIIEQANGKFTIKYRDGYETESFDTHKKRTGEKLSNFEPVGANYYWNFNESGEWNARKYLKMCAEAGRTPKFYQFLVDNGDGSFSLPEGTDKRSTAIREGYWKTLTDFKMYENDSYGRTKEDGTRTEVKGAEQKEVKPNINMPQAQRVMNEYELKRKQPKADALDMKDNNSVPAAEHAAHAFVDFLKEKRAEQSRLAEERLADKQAKEAAGIEVKPESDDAREKRIIREGNEIYNKYAKNIFMAYMGDATLGNTESEGTAYDDYYDAQQRKMAVDAETGETVKYSISDSDYIAAAERGDMETAQRIVDEAAREAGYDTEYVVWRGDAEPYNVLESGVNGGNLGTGLYFTPNKGYAEKFATRNSPVRKFYLKKGNTFDYDTFTQEFNDYAMQWLEDNDMDARMDTDEYTWSMIWDDFISENGYDSVKATGVGGLSAGASEIAVQNSWQAKLADPITYDDNGNIIPVSERFDLKKEDVRYSLPSQNILEEQLRDLVASLDQDERPLEGMTPTATSSAPGPQRAFGAKGGMLEESDIDQQAIDYVMSQDSYVADTNKAQLERAIKWIRNNKSTENSDGLFETIQKIASNDFDYRSADGQARMVAAMGIAVARGDTLAQMTLADAFNRQGTDLGRALQSRKLFRMMTPEGRIATIDSMLQKTQEELNKKGFKGELKFSEWVYAAAKVATDEGDYAKLQRMAAQEIAEQIPAKWSEKLTAWRMLAMLGNPRTHIRNILGNALFMPAVGLKNKVAALGEIATGVATEDRTKTLGLASKEARAFAKQDAKAIKDELTGDAKYKDGNLVQQERKIWGQGKGPISRTLGKALQKVSDFNGDMLELEDWIFLERHYRNALGGYMTARGLTAADMKGRVLENARAYAVQEAQKATYRDASKTADALNKLGRVKGPVGFATNAVLPFKKTPVNILRRGIEYSPVSIMKAMTVDAYHLKQYYDYQNGKLNALPEKAISPSQYIDEISSGLTGTGIAALGALLASLGAVKVSFGDDDDEFDKLRGEQEYSLKVELFGQDISATIDWAAPMSMPFFVGAATYEAANKTSSGEGVDIGALAEGLLNITEPVFNLSMLDGVNSLIDTASYGEGNALTRVGTKVATNYVTSFVPTALGQAARTIDTTRRKNYVESGAKLSTIRSAIEQTENKIPFLSKSNIPYRNVWGETDESSTVGAALENFLSPAYISEIKDDPVVDELERLYHSVSDSNKGAMVPKMPSKKIGDKALNAEEYDKYTVERGQTAKTELTNLMNSDEYTLADDETKAEMIRDVWTYANQTAQAAVTGDDSKEDKWVTKAASEDNVTNAVIERAIDRNKKAQRDGYSIVLTDALGSGDLSDAQLAIAGLRRTGMSESSIKSKVTTYYKPLYQAAYKDGDRIAMLEIEDMLDALDPDITWKYNDWLKNIEDEDEEPVETELDTSWLNRNNW